MEVCRRYIDAGIGIEYKSFLCEIGYQHNSLVLYAHDDISGTTVNYDDIIGIPMKFGGVYLKLGFTFN